MNIYQMVTDRILKQLEAGQVPWRKTWTSRLPKNVVSGREYRGTNILMLGTAGYESRYWLSYRQADQLGGHVRKGEKGTPVVLLEMANRRRADQDQGDKSGRKSRALRSLRQLRFQPRPSGGSEATGR